MSDVWYLDTQKGTWKCCCNSAPGCPARAYHTATIINDAVWLIGGGDKDTTYGDVQVYDIIKKSWESPILKGNPMLLDRTAHGACVSPIDASTILIFGGYGQTCTHKPTWLNDLVALDTKTATVYSIKAGGTPPAPRGYHTFTTCGNHCIAVGGRHTKNRIDLLLRGSDLICAYDAVENKWKQCSSGPLDSKASLEPRSSHRAVSTESGLVFFGGAGADRSRYNDLKLLELVPRRGFLECKWSIISSTGCPAIENKNHINQSATHTSILPPSRAAHAMEVGGTRLFVVGGFCGTDSNLDYSEDIWTIPISSKYKAPGIVLEMDETMVSNDGGALNDGSGDEDAPKEWRRARRSGVVAAEQKQQQQKIDMAQPTGKRTRSGVTKGLIDDSAGQLVCHQSFNAVDMEGEQEANLKKVVELESRRVASYEKEIKRLRLEITSADKQWRDAVRRATEWEMVANQARDETKRASDKARQEILNEHQRALTELQRQIHALDKEKLFRDEDLSIKTNELELLRSQYDTYKRRASIAAENQRQHSDRLEVQVNSLRAQSAAHNDKTQTDKRTIEFLRDELNERNSNLMRERQKTDAERTILRKKLKELKERAESAEGQVDALKNRVEKAEGDLKDCADKLQRKEAYATSAAERCRQYEEKERSMLDKISELERELSSRKLTEDMDGNCLRQFSLFFKSEADKFHEYINKKWAVGRSRHSERFERLG